MTKVPRRLDAEWLQAAHLTDLLAVLDRAGEEARVVGGAVRNALLGEPLGDIDIATTALPAEVVRRAQAAGFKAVPTGIEHGTVTVVVLGRPFEVTTLREDVETFGRHDPCVGIRAVPIGEAMVACVIADHYLRQRGQMGEPPAWPFVRA